jgi:hypothetical protein
METINFSPPAVAEKNRAFSGFHPGGKKAPYKNNTVKSSTYVENSLSSSFFGIFS